MGGALIMLGLDLELINRLDHNLALRRIRHDVRSDFIFAPHFDVIYAQKGDELWERVKSATSSGTFESALPVTLDVPRPSGLTRPGTILHPMDRLLYQALVDLIAPTAAEEISSERCFSHILLRGEDPQGRMFESSQESWEKFSATVREHCLATDDGWAVRADVAAYFENIDQHVLVNLLQSASCDSGAVNALEKLLSNWSQRRSRGIPQGIAPSDYLGNIFLCALDGFLEIKEVPSARFVDDIYAFFESRDLARQGLAELCRYLRHEGLHLNERKTEFLEANRLLHEETFVDRLFEEAREAAEQEAIDNIDTYVLHSVWDADLRDHLDHGEVELQAFEALFFRIDDPQVPEDKVERLCLPFFSAARSDYAVEHVLENFPSRAHQAKLYASYLAALAKEQTRLVGAIEALWNGEALVYDWQRLWLGAGLWFLEDVSGDSVRTALRKLSASSSSEPLRAVCAILVGKHGTASQKRVLRNHYSSENSSYVKSALVFAAQYFPTSERKACLRAWSGHSIESALVARAVTTSA